MPYQNFEELNVRKKARQLKNELCQIAKSFPNEEKFRLTDQLIRSSRSVNTQVAEGHGRRTYPDRIRFCTISRGSSSETLNHLIDAFDCNYIDLPKLNDFREKSDRSRKTLKWLYSIS